MGLNENIRWQPTQITRRQRENLIDQIGLVVLLTGLSGSGKSTIATGVERLLYEENKLTYILDGDNIRHGVSRDLGFEKKDRKENMRRIGEVAHLLSQTGIITILSFIAPFQKERQQIKELIGDRFIEVHVDCQIDSCIERDVKGLYAKVKRNEIKEFTGVTSPYERPETPHLVINTDLLREEEAIEKLFALIIDMERRVQQDEYKSG